jgi:putrescine aminotransferase
VDGVHGGRVARVLVEEGGECFHGFTYSRHPAACAVALANVRILRDERLVERAETDIGPYLQRRWCTLAKHPPVGEVRGLGMLCALEIVQDRMARRFFEPRGEVGQLCRDFGFDNGLVMRAVKDTMIVAPPSIIRREAGGRTG